MDIKILFSVFSTGAVCAAYVPYIKDILAKKTEPHIYTWLIWSISTGTATLGIWYGGGKWGSLSTLVTFFLVCLVVLLSFKYGTKNIVQFDKVTLAIAICAVFVWWRLNQPLLAVLMVTIIDILAYLPTYRKSWEEPWSETLSSWILFSLYALFGVLALAQYNLLTTMYLVAVLVANVGLVLLLTLRRSVIPIPHTRN